MRRLASLVVLCVVVPPLQAQPGPKPIDWKAVGQRKPMTIAETRAFMRKLAQFVFDHHLRQDDAPMKGMVYEYFDVAKKGQFDQFVQGEALDTMHDGCWLANALVNAYRATGDPFYRDFLTEHLLPFYCKMLNHSDTLFSAKKDDVRDKGNKFGKEHQLQEGEKGFVPYWWDDGGSVSLERRRDKNPRPAFSATDNTIGKDNRKHLLDGYSHGSSNHLAQDLGVMLQQSWLLLREEKDDKLRKLADEVKRAAKHLHECRMRHHGHIPMCDAPAALAWNDAALMKHVPDMSGPNVWKPSNHYTKALYDFKPGERCAFPGFADDQQYRYYAGLARHGGKVPRPLAFRLIYDAYTEPMLYRIYCDDEPAPAGMNRFDLHPNYCKDGRPEDYRSDKKGPAGKPRPSGSRMGPQNMACAGVALQLLKEYPGVWEEAQRHIEPNSERSLLGPGRIPFEFKGFERIPNIHFGWEVSFFGDGIWLLMLPDGGKESAKQLLLNARADGKGKSLDLRIDAKLKVSARNDEGEMVEHATPRNDLAFMIVVPFTMAKRQRTWANGVEHRVISISDGKRFRNLYLASPEGLVKAWLEWDLGHGLRTWEAVFDAYGYIPTGMGAGADWERFSDSGGYAHLISAASQWILYQQGKKDWELHNVPVVK